MRPTIKILENINFIFKTLRVPEYFVGSLTYSYATYRDSNTEITMHVESRWAVSGEILSIESPRWLMTINQTINRRNAYFDNAFDFSRGATVYWNNKVIKETKKSDNDYIRKIQFLGNISDIKEDYTALVMTKNFSEFLDV